MKPSNFYGLPPLTTEGSPATTEAPTTTSTTSVREDEEEEDVFRGFQTYVDHDMFMDSLTKGNAAQIKKYVSDGFDLNRPLVSSISLQCDLVTKFAASNCIFVPSTLGNVSKLPLISAIDTFDVDAVYLLLELGADPNHKPVISGCPNNPSPLQYAKTLAREKIHFRAKEIARILENHVRAEAENGKNLDGKINRISRRVSDADDIIKELDQFQADYLKSEDEISTENGVLNNLKRDAKQITARWMEMKAELEAIKLEKRSVSDKVEAKEAELCERKKDNFQKLSSKSEELRSKKSYMRERKLSYHRALLRRLRKKRDSVVVDRLGSALECVVCLVVPTSGNIYACAGCDNIMCAKCAPKLKTCPACGQNFKTKPYFRNKAVESIAHKLTV